MNLTRALDVALPEIPARTLAERYPRLDPGATFREHTEEGKAVVRIYIPSSKLMFTLPSQCWKLVQFFDGKRSYEEIAEAYSQENGVEYDEQAVRDLAADLEAINFWFKTPQEKNILLMQQTAAERRKKMQQRSRWADLSMVTFPAFNPDLFLTVLYRYTKFIYTPWFTTLTLIAFALTAGITITHWREIGRDTQEFFNFYHKTWIDIVVLYSLALAVVVVHEFAHAYVSKHFGGRVTAMGLALIYLTPALYTDTTEAETLTTRYERFIITVAGVWSELMICAVATFVWWGTAPDTDIHNGAYFLMMITGWVSILLNWNPLMKLDGYYMLSEALGISDLKENSTAYVSGWVKKHIWHLPVEVPYIPRRRRPGYVLYAILSGIYSYTMLYVVARFAGNVVRNFSPEWGFIPEIAVALLIFRSRIQLLGNFMKFLYLDKKDRIAASFTLKRSLAMVVLGIMFLALPLWKDSVSGRFILEPAKSVFVRAHVPGVVSKLLVEEGQVVSAGEDLAVLRNLPAQSEYEIARARLSMATERSQAASIHYADYGAALKDQEQLSAEVAEIGGRNSELQLRSPISGVIITPRVRERNGTYLSEGGELLEVADISSLRARIYVSEYELYRVGKNARAKLQVQGIFGTREAEISSIAPTPSIMDPKLIGEVTLQGMNPPHYFLVDLIVQNPNLALRPGQAGIARIFAQRRSLFALAWRMISDFWGRKIW